MGQAMSELSIIEKYKHEKTPLEHFLTPDERFAHTHINIVGNHHHQDSLIILDASIDSPDGSKLPIT